MRRRDLMFIATVCLLGLSGCAATPEANAPARFDVALRVDAERELPLRVWVPARGRRWPLLLFSHGAFSSGQDYDALLSAWARAGFVVIAPTHRDSTRLGTKRGSQEPRWFGWRLDDMHAVASGLEDIVSSVPALRGRIDATRIGATGHSFGGLVAQTLGGASYQDVTAGRTVTRPLANVRAVLIFSGAGAMEPLLRPLDFAGLTLPTLVTVGTDDLAQAPGLTGYQWRRQPYDLIPAGNKFLLTLDGADHYLGGAVGRDDLPRSPLADRYVAAFNNASSAFLRRFVAADNVTAPALTVSDPVARLEQR
jgi:dienelactone hydrolase